MLLRRANATKARANATKTPDQHKHEQNCIPASHKMLRRGTEILILGLNHFKFLLMFADFKVKFVTFTSIILNEE